MHGLAIATDFWGGLAAGASVVAAVAALATVRYARATVADARQGRCEAAAQHEAVLAEQQRTAAAMEAAKEETRRAATDAQAAYKDERAAAAQALAMQQTLRRIDQIDRITHLLGSLANIARDEAVTPPPAAGMQGFPLTRIPTVLAELRTAMALHTSLGGAELPNVHELAVNGYALGREPMQFLGRAQAALDEIGRLVANDDRYLSVDRVSAATA